LEALVGGNLTRVGVARLRLDRAAAASPEILELGYFASMVEELDTLGDDDRSTVDHGDRSVAPIRDCSHMSAQKLCVQLEIGLRAILAHELRTPPSNVPTDRAFPELGLDSMMVMEVLRKTKKLVGIDELSPTMLWNHPTVASLAAYLANKLLPQEYSESDVDVASGSAGSVLDALFDSVESAPAGSESGI
jgi:phthiocerol/phenolphthiocerol synthesis type-I polyketide synthase D